MWAASCGTPGPWSWLGSVLAWSSGPAGSSVDRRGGSTVSLTDAESRTAARLPPTPRQDAPRSFRGYRFLAVLPLVVLVALPVDFVILKPSLALLNYAALAAGAAVGVVSVLKLGGSGAG